jgi:hypothetical protein
MSYGIFLKFRVLTRFGVPAARGGMGEDKHKVPRLQGSFAMRTILFARDDNFLSAADAPVRSG